MRQLLLLLLLCQGPGCFSQAPILTIPAKYWHTYKGKTNPSLVLTVKKNGFTLVDKSTAYCYGGKCDSTGKILGWYEINGTNERYGNTFSLQMDKKNIFHLIIFKPDDITVDKEFIFVRLKE